MTATTLLRSSTRHGTAYIDVGAGEPVVVIHGVGLRLEAWTPQIHSLAESHRVIALDMPGHGLSTPLNGVDAVGGDLAAYVDWLIALLDDLDLEQVNLAGHSMGALIAGCCAITHHQRVQRVALVSPIYRRDHAATLAVAARADDISAGRIEPGAPLARWFPSESTVSEPHRLTRQWLEDVDPLAYARAYRVFAQGDDSFADGWPGVTCPALFLTGELDQNSTPAMSIAMAKAAPYGESCVIAGHRHMVNLTAPRAVTAALQHWLNRKVMTQ